MSLRIPKEPEALNRFIQENKFDQFYSLSPEKFEEFVAEALSYKFKRTKRIGKSGDFGTDVLAEDYDGNKVAIQVKRYKSTATVGSKAVYEVIAGMQYYSCTMGMVITTAKISKNAHKIASVANVELWDYNSFLAYLDKYVSGGGSKDELLIRSSKYISEDNPLSFKLVDISADQVYRKPNERAFFFKILMTNGSERALNYFISTCQIRIGHESCFLAPWSNYPQDGTIQAGMSTEIGLALNQRFINSSLLDSAFRIKLNYNIYDVGESNLHDKYSFELNVPLDSDRASWLINNPYRDANQGSASVGWFGFGLLLFFMLLGWIISSIS